MTLVLPLLFLLFSQAFCWGWAGHRLAASIADFYLSPAAKRAVNLWLGPQALVNVSTDADSYLNEPNSSWSKDLHYCNLPDNATDWTMENGCANQLCAVTAVHNYTRLTALGPSGGARWVRYPPVPLAFLVHFYSDLHQPLHVGYFSDRGGNSIKADFLGQDTNLHSIWDSGWLRALNTTWEELLPQYIKEIEANPVWRSQWRFNLQPELVAKESFRVVRTEAYKFTPEERKPNSSRLNLGLPYIQRVYPTIKTRLMQTGYRLAMILNSLFR